MVQGLVSFLRHNFIALLALCVALGGVSYAAVKLPKNSVGTKQIKKRAVTAKKIKKNAVNSSKVKNRSLLKKDFKAGQLPKGAPGVTGPAGATGLTGAVSLANSGIVSNGPPTGGESGVVEGSPYSEHGSVEIETPAPGYILVSSNAYLRTNTPVTGICTAEISLWYEDALVGPRSLTTFNAADGDPRYESVGMSHAIAVTGGTHVVETKLRINPNVSPSCDGFILGPDAYMTALWVPYGQVQP